MMFDIVNNGESPHIDMGGCAKSPCVYWITGEYGDIYCGQSISVESRIRSHYNSNTCGIQDDKRWKLDIDVFETVAASKHREADWIRENIHRENVRNKAIPRSPDMTTTTTPAKTLKKKDNNKDAPAKAPITAEERQNLAVQQITLEACVGSTKQCRDALEQVLDQYKLRLVAVNQQIAALDGPG